VVCLYVSKILVSLCVSLSPLSKFEVSDGCQRAPGGEKQRERTREREGKRERDREKGGQEREKERETTGDLKSRPLKLSPWCV